jgi:5-methylcytosine-specific restriction enzyme subunit McrC
VTSRLSVIDTQLGELSSVRFAAAAVDGFTYHRLNEHYRSPHLLARLFLEGAGITDESGQYDFRTFLVNMNALFEEFVRTVLSEELQFEYEVVGHPPLRLDRAGKLLARPDIALLCGGDIRFIADCKYEVTAGELSAGHLYQVLSYCTISGITRGMLIYPLHAVELADLVDIERSPIGIHRHVIDLNLEPGQLADCCRSLAESVRSWVSGTSPLGVLVG